MWSSYKAKVKGIVSKCVPVLKVDGKWVRNPMVVTDRYVDDGEIVYGEFKSGAELKEAKAFVKEHQPNADFELLDKEVDKIVWTFANLFPGCLMKSMDGIRQKKKFFWDTMKYANRHWLKANMAGEAFLGFGAFNTKKITGENTIDFIKFRQNIADVRTWDMDMFAEVMGKPKE
jgi:6-oxo-cyclohex-1-ene-carbonyl-CoA hydrolase